MIPGHKSCGWTQAARTGDSPPFPSRVEHISRSFRYAVYRVDPRGYVRTLRSEAEVSSSPTGQNRGDRKLQSLLAYC